MHADRRYLRIIGRLHSLARHRHQLSIDPYAKKRSQFVGSQRKGAGLGEFGQFHHRWSVIRAERNDVGGAGPGFGRRPDHLFSRRGEENFELRGSGHRFRRKQHGLVGCGHQRAECFEALCGYIRHCRERRDGRRIAPRQRAAFRQRLLAGCQRIPNRMIKRVHRLIHGRFGISSPRCTAGRARPRSSQAETFPKLSNATSSRAP